MHIRRILGIVSAALCLLSCNKTTTIYDFKAESNGGEEVNFADYKGKVLLVVNTASKCGFTPQYEGLEDLYKKYRGQGLVIVGFPCDQFGHQEPGTDEEIEEFCRLNYGVTFPLMAKSDVNGENANDIFKWLYSEKPFAGFGDSDRGKAVDYMVIPQGTEERELLELFNEMQWLERTRLLEYAKKLSEKKNSTYNSRRKKAMRKIAEFCDIEIYMDEEFSGSPAVDVNYLDDDVQGSIDLERGLIKGDFSKYVLPVIEAWLREHREMLMEMWKEKKIGLIPAWE